MPFRSVVAEPQDLTRLSVAFDAAWIGINSAKTFTDDQKSVARERLSYIIIGLWKQGEEHLTAKSVEFFLAQDEQVSPTTRGANAT